MNNYRGVVLAEVAIVWMLYMIRHGRLKLLKGAIDGALTINSAIPVGSSGSSK